MEVEATLFLGLTGIDLPLSGSPGLELSGGLRALTERASIARFVGGYEDSLGGVEAAFLRKLVPAVAYRRFTIDIDLNNLGASINGALIRALADVHIWLTRLWLIKDNAVDADVGWMGVRVNDELTVNNNRWSASVSKADGRMSATSFSRAELNRAANVPLSSGYWSTSGPIALEISAGQDPAITKLADGSLRFQRFLYFIQAGRSTPDLAIKISHWCSGLETLVSSAQSELSHQVSERVACALEPLGDQRLLTFKLVKSAYGMRSKAVHGAPFKDKDASQLSQTCVEIDEICRRLARKYFEDEEFSDAIESKSPEFDNFWISRILVGNSLVHKAET